MLNAMLPPTSRFFIPAGLVAHHEVALSCIVHNSNSIVDNLPVGLQYRFGSIVSLQNGILPGDPSMKGRRRLLFII